MQTVEFNDKITVIPSSAFQECKKLSGVIIPISVSAIHRFAFSDCTSLTEIVLSSNVTWLGDSAFEGCTSLMSITINGDVEFQAAAFYNIASGSKIYINNEESKISLTESEGIYDPTLTTLVY